MSQMQQLFHKALGFHFHSAQGLRKVMKCQASFDH